MQREAYEGAFGINVIKSKFSSMVGNTTDINELKNIREMACSELASSYARAVESKENRKLDMVEVAGGGKILNTAIEIIERTGGDLNIMTEEVSPSMLAVADGHVTLEGEVDDARYSNIDTGFDLVDEYMHDEIKEREEKLKEKEKEDVFPQQLK
jgi:hypothetical protein